jgi:hypothetical protein
MNRKRFDMGDFADKRSGSGHRFTAIVVVGDQEKYSEIIGRLASKIDELAKSISHQEEFERLVIAEIVAARSAIEEAGIEMITEPLLGNRQPPPPSSN